MARLIAFDVLAFLLPFAAYGAWLFATRGSLSNASDWPVRTVAYLAMGGAVMMLIAIVFFISFDTGQPGKTYVPARLENGVIVPGHFE
ncbi:MAG: hypothetical protein F9K43_11715 [Bauldia sp.]|jgi:hypothetical protein|nr:MAG: hypothetical protein F9K43_11715 [Bauldia sp.]MBZ0226836.1 DUF6111 family protein [Bauldia sp.]